MLRDWPEDFRYVLSLQEASAVGTASGYAMTTGQAQLVSLHSAGGVGHALGAVFNAYRDRAPLVVIAGQQTEPYCRPGCASGRASGAGDLEARLAEALDHDGPYLLDVPVATTSAPLY